MVRHPKPVKAKVEFYELRDHIVRNIVVLTELINHQKSYEIPPFSIIFDDYDKSTGEREKLEITMFNPLGE